MAKKTKRNLTAPKKEGKSRALAILSPTLVPVDFYGDQLYFVDEDGCWVPMRPIVEALNLSWSRQRKKIKEDPVLATVVAQWATQVASNNQKRLRTYIKLDYLNGWLFKINPNKVPDPTARKRVIRYQKECYEVLSRHYQAHLVFKNEVLAKLPDPESRPSQAIDDVGTFTRCARSTLMRYMPQGQEEQTGKMAQDIVDGAMMCAGEMQTIIAEEDEILSKTGCYEKIIDQANEQTAKGIPFKDWDIFLRLEYMLMRKEMAETVEPGLEQCAGEAKETVIEFRNRAAQVVSEFTALPGVREKVMALAQPRKKEIAQEGVEL